MGKFIDLAKLDRPRSPNTYLVGPEEFFDHAAPDDTVTLPVDPVSAYDEMVAYAQAQVGWAIVERAAETMRLSATVTTPILKFKDDIDIAVVAVAGGCAPVIYSRSRVGYSDLGANRKRVQSILAHLQSIKVKA